MLKRAVLFIGIAIILAGIASADEGMWLFNAFPKARVKAKYGFEPTQAWLDNVRLSSVRFNNGGSGSFVSPHGLTFTNHHVGAVCVQQLSTGGKDYMKTGFYAKTQADEAKCPDLELNVLQSIEDVTQQIQSAAKPGSSAAEAGAAQRAAMSAIESDCAKSTGLRCDIVTLYAGGMFQLYRYKKYTDVRLVFAPEFEAAFFGGDPDNFEYPRYDLDITFFRVYENNKPVDLTHSLRWSKAGASEGDLIFVPGNPGSTGRLLTMAQLEFLRDTSYPWRLKSLREMIQTLKSFSAQSPENARRAQEDIFGMENSLKALTGYQSGLLDKKLMAQKQQDEDKLKQGVASDPQKKQKFGDPWAKVAQAESVYKQIYLPYIYLERRQGLRGDLPGIARILVRAAVEKQKPNGERLREYRESALSSVEQQLFSTAPIYKDLETITVTESLRQMQRDLGHDPAVAQVLKGQEPAQAAKALMDGTKLDDVAVRKQLYAGGEAAVNASTDPLIVAMRNLDPEARKYRKQYEDQVESVERRTGATLSKIRFAELGTDTYPDATFTLRLSYGVVKGYTEDGRGDVASAGTKLPYFTTFAGAFEHAAKHSSKPPYRLPQSWMQNKSKIKLDTPLNAIETADIIGGNSGSPVVNKAGDVVGIIFDGNIQSLPWNFQYEDEIGRSLHVDSRGILEALRNIYGATRLADELAGSSAAAAKK
ncbi:MAG: S46 family peptidase [Acidobacteriia bacterium]|nr:S46 family peptidase [Terriglobia bacterium]